MGAYATTAVVMLMIRSVATARRAQPVGRRRWLRWATLGALAVAAAQAGIAINRLAWPNGVWERSLVTIPIDRVPAVGAAPLRHADGRLYLSRVPEGILALSWRCTHLGCPLPWQAHSDQFVCPCHPSQFDRYGAPLPGSVARQPLDLFEVTVTRRTIAINTARLRRRDAIDVSQITPLG